MAYAWRIIRAFVCVLTLLLLATPASAQLFWRIDGVSASWTSSNWGTSAGGPFNTAWVNSSNTIFNANSLITYVTNTPIGNIQVATGITVTVSQAGTLSTGGNIRTVDVGAGSTLTWTGQGFSTGAGTGFIKNGNGTWNMGAQGNMYPGGFTLNAGTIIISGNNTFGNGAININGGTIQSSGTRNFNGSGITIGGDFTTSGTGDATFSQAIGLGAGTRTITNNITSGSRVYSGVISGAAGSGLTFNGTATAPSYLSNVANTFSGPISINSGQVGFTNDGALGNSTSVVLDGGKLTASTITATTVSYTLGSGRNLQVGPSAGTGINVVGAGVITYNGVIADKPSTTGTWEKTGTGSLLLGGVSTYTGGTIISEGTLQLNSGNDRLPVSTSILFPTGSNANFLALGNDAFGGAISQTVAGLSSTGSAVTSAVMGNTAANSTLIINNSASNTFNGTIGGLGTNSNNLNIIKSNSGTLSLGGTNTYTGTTLVSGGKLLVTGTHAGGTYTVDTGGTLGGNGTIDAAVNIVTGTLAPGNSTDRLTINGAVAFINATSSVFNVEINGPTVVTDYDQLRVGATGSLNITGATLTASLGFDPVGTEKIFITDDLFAGPVTGTFNNLAQGASITLTSPSNIVYMGIISYQGDFIGPNFNTFGGNDIVIHSFITIPEPGTIALLGLTGFFGLQWYLRRKPAVVKKDCEKSESETIEPAPVQMVA